MRNYSLCTPNEQRAVSVSKQLRRIEHRRRQRATIAIASMTLSQQMTLACDLWKIEQRLKVVTHA